MCTEFKNGDITVSKDEYFYIVYNPDNQLYNLIHLPNNIMLLKNHTLDSLNKILNGLKHTLYNRMN